MSIQRSSTCHCLAISVAVTGCMVVSPPQTELLAVESVRRSAATLGVRRGQLVRFDLPSEPASTASGKVSNMSTATPTRIDAEAQILIPEAAAFLTLLAREFEDRRQALLARRRVRQEEIDGGRMPDFLPATADIREAEWTVAPIPKD